MPIRFASCAPESDAATRAQASNDRGQNNAAVALFSFAALWRAYVACRRGKRRAASAQRFAQRVFDHLLDTAQALQGRLWRPSTATCFVVTRPKAREVLAADFGDRVVHHLLVPHLERQFEPVFIHDAWSNRRGKGIHGAVARLRGFMQALTDNGARPGWALQLDIANFFNRIDRERLYALVEQRLRADVDGSGRAAPGPRNLSRRRADDLLWLTRRLLTGNAAQGARLVGSAASFARLPQHKRLLRAPVGVGLPIGNLSSQFFANVYMNELDQFVKHQLKCRHYLRYVDDFVLLAPDVVTLLAWRAHIEQYLSRHLGLALRDAGRIVPVADGLDFLGYRVRATHLLARPRVAGHLREALNGWQQRWLYHANGVRVLNLPSLARHALAARVASCAAHLRHARHARLWQRLRTRFWVLRALFAPPDAVGACAPRWQAPPSLARLPQQWHWFARQGAHWFHDVLAPGWPGPCTPGAAPVTAAAPMPSWLLLMQVGHALESYGPHARRLAAAWPDHGAQPVWRRGMGWGLAWPLARRPQLLHAVCRLGWPVAWVAEEAYLPHGGKRRVLRQLRLPWPPPPPDDNPDGGSPCRAAVARPGAQTQIC